MHKGGGYTSNFTVLPRQNCNLALPLSYYQPECSTHVNLHMANQYRYEDPVQDTVINDSLL